MSLGDDRSSTQMDALSSREGPERGRGNRTARRIGDSSVEHRIALIAPAALRKRLITHPLAKEDIAFESGESVFPDTTS